MSDERETIHVRGEGGTVWEMDLPLRPDHAARLDAGQLVRVNADGSAWSAPATAEADPAATDGDDPDGDGDGGSPEDDTPPELREFLDTPPDPVAPKPRTAAAKPKGK